MQLLPQYVEFAHAVFNQLEFIVQQLRHGVVRIGGVPQRRDTVADLAEWPGLIHRCAWRVSKGLLTLEHTPGFTVDAP